MEICYICQVQFPFLFLFFSKISLPNLDAWTCCTILSNPNEYVSFLLFSPFHSCFSIEFVLIVDSSGPPPMSYAQPVPQYIQPAYHPPPPPQALQQSGPSMAFLKCFSTSHSFFSLKVVAFDAINRVIWLAIVLKILPNQVGCEMENI